MLNMSRMSKMLEHMNMRQVSRDSGVSIYHVRKVKNADGNTPYSVIEKLSNYFRDKLGVE